MKIFATSDLHGQLAGLNPSGCDVCVIAGDIGPLKGFGNWHIHDQVKWMRKQFCNFCTKFPDVEFVIIPGNHDWGSVKKMDFLRELDNKVQFPDNVHCLIDSSVEIGGKIFYGTPWIPIISYSWAYEAEPENLRHKFSMIPENVDVLISHAPPHIENQYIDYSMQTNRGPFGSIELTDAIAIKKPKYLFCGHIHSGDHDVVVYEDTKCFNVSRIDERYEIAYEPTIVTI